MARRASIASIKCARGFDPISSRLESRSHKKQNCNGAKIPQTSIIKIPLSLLVARKGEGENGSIVKMKTRYPAELRTARHEPLSTCVQAPGFWFFRRAPSVPFKRQGGESLCLFSVSSRAAYGIPEGLSFVNTLTDKDIQGNGVAASRSGLVFN